jgi:hypothetical protein
VNAAAGVAKTAMARAKRDVMATMVVWFKIFYVRRLADDVKVASRRFASSRERNPCRGAQ